MPVRATAAALHVVRLQVVGMLIPVVDAVRRHDIRLVGLHERGESVGRGVDGYGA